MERVVTRDRVSPLWSLFSLWLKSRTAPDPQPPGPAVPGGASGCVCAHGRRSNRGGGKKAGALLLGSLPLPLGALGGQRLHQPLFPALVPLCLPYLLLFIPVTFHLLPSFASFTLPLFLPSFLFPPFCFFLLIPQVRSSILAIPSLPSLSPTGLPGSLFLVPSSSSFFSPPAPHTGVFGPGCHQWRNQRKLLHRVSGWLSGHYASHLCEW